ncbi:MAG: glycogen debranching enzyme N-terminal domain-containing protein [Pirellulales bacterium]|nr:glycogen debranching enzyme N-terminal domain-containing protein [Pirellulales bacterium]
MAGIEAEWLEADGLGGYASGTVRGVRTRRYHALLLVATTPPTGRMVLVGGMEVWVRTRAGTYALTTQHYAPDVMYPDGERRARGFEREPWPTWRFALEDGTQIEHALCAPHDSAATTLTWRLVEPRDRGTLYVRPLLAGRDYHGLHHENSAFCFDAQVEGERVTWQPYEGVPRIIAFSNAQYKPGPDWYRRFLYVEEQRRGLDSIEDLASPGTFEFDLSQGEAVWLLSADVPGGITTLDQESASDAVARLRANEQSRRAGFAGRLARSADAYLVRRGAGRTIVAGYPWFTDWGRDTFIALRGLCLATGRLDIAGEILVAWASCVSEGMLPNRYPDAGDTLEFNSVDASLWYVVAVHEFLAEAERSGYVVTSPARVQLEQAVQAIVAGYAAGTRFGIRADEDGLLACGVPGWQLTWMDAKVGDYVVTPRMGKPVEVQALWLNALAVAASHAGADPRFAELLRQGKRAFATRFWSDERGYLADVVDVDHQPGTVDESFRPNQIFAVGGLPLMLLDAALARRVVEAVETRLVTPMGLRTLAPGSPGYAGRYEGGVNERDGAYHQGTAWPWLMGAFVEAWVRARDASSEAKQEARERFIRPLMKHLDEAGLEHVSEIADGDAPFTPRGCPWQAWSLGELIRLTEVVLK